jgi:hypothetical protein
MIRLYIRDFSAAISRPRFHDYLENKKRIENSLKRQRKWDQSQLPSSNGRRLKTASYSKNSVKRGHNNTPFGRPTPGWPISHPGVGHPQGVYGVFTYCKSVMSHHKAVSGVACPQGVEE